MDLFEFAKISDEVSLIDRINKYIKNGNIKHVNTIADYSEVEVRKIDIKEQQIWWSNYGKVFQGIVPIKGFNYYIWHIFQKHKNNIKEYLEQVKKVFGETVYKNNLSCLQKCNYDLNYFEKEILIRPQKRILIEAETADEVLEIAKDCELLVKQIKIRPELLKKRNYKKVVFHPYDINNDDIGYSIDELIC